MSALARVRRALPLLFLAVPFLLLRSPTVQTALLSLLEVMRAGGVKGAALYALLYGVGGLFALPLALLSAMAGFAYGPFWGVVFAVPSLVFGAMTGFLSGRLFARSMVRQRLAGNARWALIEAVLKEEGFKVTLLLRLTPLVPQNFLPYLVASTELRLGSFLLATGLGMFPITCLHVYIGSLVQSAAEVVQGGGQGPGTAQRVLLVGGLVASVLAAVGTARIARRTLERMVEAKREQGAVKEGTAS